MMVRPWKRTDGADMGVEEGDGAAQDDMEDDTGDSTEDDGVGASSGIGLIYASVRSSSGLLRRALAFAG